MAPLLATLVVLAAAASTTGTAAAPAQLHLRNAEPTAAAPATHPNQPHAAPSASPTPYPLAAPLLTTASGEPVRTTAEWESVRRPQVAALLQQHLVGTLPATPPPLLFATVVNSSTTSTASCVAVQDTFVRLVFNTSAGGNANTPTVAYDVEVLAPVPAFYTARRVSPSSAPLFMTQVTHRQWAVAGVARGFVGVVYPAADQSDVAPAFQAAYPSATMALIVARAWVASRTLDYLTSPAAAALNITFNASRVCVTGHSRNGKQSLLFAALDTRVAAVVGSSPGAPISSPYAFSSHNFYGEGPDAGQAGHWWLPNITAYTDAPQTLPMDGHGVLALIAPRRCVVFVAWQDPEGSLSFAAEMAHVLASPVFALYNATSALRLVHRGGGHHGYVYPSQYFDEFSAAFGWRPSAAASGAPLPPPPPPASATPQRYITPAGFDWMAWAAAAAPVPSPPPPTAPAADRMRWVLQLDVPVPPDAGSTYSEQQPAGAWLTHLLQRDDTAPGVSRLPLAFGSYVTANAYWSTATAATAPRPVVIWLHPYSYTTGYSPAYNVSDMVTALATAGFLVLPFDQVGAGSRVTDGGPTFYGRYGTDASLLGAMVADVGAAVDMLTRVAAREGPLAAAHVLPPINASHILVAGYSLGGTVALHAAALDARLAGVASVAGFTPLRTDANSRPTYGLRRLYALHALLPRLGLFAADPAGVPYDYSDDVWSLVAPRAALLYTPVRDRDATFADVVAATSNATRVWAQAGAPAQRLTVTAPNTGTQLADGEVAAVVAWARGTL